VEQKVKKFQIIPRLRRNDFLVECCFWETAFLEEAAIFPSWNRNATAFAFDKKLLQANEAGTTGELK
jgi:hypothetical protein